MNNKKIVIGCDQAAYELKQDVMKHLEERCFEYTDVGTYSTESVNYPDYAHNVCEKIQNGEADYGILICGTGIGMSIVANKHKGIRAACCSDTFSAEMTRKHNDANVLCFGARVIGKGVALQLVDSFLDSEFEGGRHWTRVDMINEYDN